MKATATGYSLIAVSAALTFAGVASAQEPPGAAPPPSQPAVSVSLGGAASAPAPAAEASPAADQGSSSDSKKDDRDPSPSTYEFALISVGATQAWNIAGRILFVGGGGGLGPALYRYSQFTEKTPTGEKISHDAGWNANLDIVYGQLFIRFAPVPYVDLDVGPKIAVGATLYDVPDAPQSAFTYGGYADLRVGSRTVKLGPRFEYVKMAHSNFTQTGWILTPLMLRVAH